MTSSTSSRSVSNWRTIAPYVKVNSSAFYTNFSKFRLVLEKMNRKFWNWKQAIFWNEKKGGFRAYHTFDAGEDCVAGSRSNRSHVMREWEWDLICDLRLALNNNFFERLRFWFQIWSVSDASSSFSRGLGSFFFFSFGWGVMSGPSLAQTKFSRPMAL